MKMAHVPLRAVIVAVVMGLSGLLAVSAAQADPLTQLEEALRRAAVAEYLADYDVTTTITRQGQPHTDAWRQVVTQAGSRRKAETYARGIVLLQSVLQTEEGLLLCAYGEDPDQPQCLQTAGAAADGTALETLRYAITKGLVKLQVSDSSVQVGDMQRPCRQFTYSMHLDTLTPDTLKGLLTTAFPHEAFTDVTPVPSAGLQSLTSTVCLDEELGIPLTATSSLRGHSGDPAQPLVTTMESTQTLTWLTLEPHLMDEDFARPPNADIVPVSE